MEVLYCFKHINKRKFLTTEDSEITELRGDKTLCKSERSAGDFFLTKKCIEVFIEFKERVFGYAICY